MCRNKRETKDTADSYTDMNTEVCYCSLCVLLPINGSVRANEFMLPSVVDSESDESDPWCENMFFNTDVFFSEMHLVTHVLMS